MELTLALDAAGLIERLFFQPAFEHTPATSWEELGTAVENLPAETTLVVTDVTDPDAPEVVFSSGEEGAFPVGSIVKLYVLGAVVDAVEAGTLTWEDTLTVTDDLKSLPSGELQDAPSGTTVTVREAAEAMIAISDNTATDMLVAAVGREAVETQLAEMGHHDPSLNIPLLTTRDLFVIGWGDDATRRTTWADGDETVRRDLLASLPSGLPGVDPLTVSTPVWQDGVDWFATPEDLVAAHLALQKKAETPAGEPVPDILGANPGFAPEVASTFDEVAFKGGSSMGVLALSWFVSGPDGDHVLTLQARSDQPSLTTDGRPYLAATQDAVMLLE
ncbi:serine hydrolase [Serinibacter arcticus]|uniref:serine hydrolase n=1 Tax=Serinibacter arcticus TaxID=1655435 RepID=UPI003AF32C74